MQYGHASTKRAPTRKTSTFNASHTSQTKIHASDLENEKTFLFGPWEDRVKRSIFEPSRKRIEIEIFNYLLRGGKIKGLPHTEPGSTQKVRAIGQHAGNGLDSGSSIYC